MKITDLNRYQAFTSHLIISLIIFFVILICITQLWYPGILFDTDNGWKAIGLIIGIDLILGPLLTLIVFNPQKPSLKADLSIIAAIQVIALVYGTWTIHSSRPIAIAFINNSFITFYANADNATEVLDKISSLETNQFYYLFDDKKTSTSLDLNNLHPYKNHAKSIISINSAYIAISKETNQLTIQLDPLASSNRYLAVNKKDGSIIKFTKTPK